MKLIKKKRKTQFFDASIIKINFRWCNILFYNPNPITTAVETKTSILSNWHWMLSRTSISKLQSSIRETLELLVLDGVCVFSVW